MGPEVRQLTPLGAEIVGASVDYLLDGGLAPEKILDLLESNGVLVFRGLGFDDRQQLAFSKQLGDVVVKSTQGWSTKYPGIYRVALDTESNDPAYVKGTFQWHIDGATLEIPVKASVLSARVVSGAGGDTQFSSTYAAYDRLTEEEKLRFGALKVWHSVYATVRKVETELAPEALERIKSEPARLHPLVWTHRSGNRSLVIGLTASHIEGMTEAEGRDLLDELLERATKPEFVYSHHWEPGDLVIWDNRGVLHRVEPYDSESGREMHRVNLVGDEAIQ